MLFNGFYASFSGFLLIQGKGYKIVLNFATKWLFVIFFFFKIRGYL